jgi:hypothetical protein
MGAMIIIALIAVWAAILVVAVAACRAAAAGDRQIATARTDVRQRPGRRPFAA